MIPPAIRNISETDIRKLFHLVREKTQNFTQVPTELFIELPRSILIFRLIINEKRKDFAKKIDVSESTLAGLESGRTKIKNTKTATKYSKNIQKIINTEFLKTANVKTVLKNFRNFLVISAGGNLVNTFTNREIAKKAGLISVSEKELTDFEKEISKKLEIFGFKKHQEKEKCSLTYEIHAILEGLNKNYNVDFVIPSSGNPLIVIEATQTKGLTNQTNMAKAYRLNSRFANLKRKFPNTEFIALIKCNDYSIPQVFFEEITYGKVLNINELEEYLINIKNKLAAIVQP